MITLTKEAAEYAKKLLEKEEIRSPPGGIRFGIKAGGCSGFEYFFKAEKSDETSDHIYILLGVRVLINPKCLDLMRGTEIGISNNLLDSKFTFMNPNAKATCGCGVSFELKEKEK